MNLREHISKKSADSRQSGFRRQMRLKTLMVSIFVLAALLAGCGTGKAAGEGSTAGGAAAGEATTAASRLVTSGELLEGLDYDPTEYVILPDNYNALSIEVEGDYEFSEDKYKELIDSYLSSMTTYEPTDKDTVEDGDAVNIDYEGKVDGETFDGGSAEGYDLVIGSNSFIEGFETGLIGKKLGETIDLNLTFPEDYQAEDLAGKDVVFTVTINSINKVVSMSYDTLTDDYVKENLSYYGYSTKEEFLDGQRELYKSDLETQKKQAVETAYDSKLYEESDFSNLPQKMVDEAFDEQMEKLSTYAKENDMTTEEYLQQAGYTEDSFREYIESSYKKSIMYQALIKDMDFTLNAAEVDEEINNYAQNYGMTEEEFFDQFGGKTEVYRQMAYSHVMEELAQDAEDQGRVKVTGTDGGTTQALPVSGVGLAVLAGLLVLIVLITGALLVRSGRETEDPAPAEAEESSDTEKADDQESDDLAGAEAFEAEDTEAVFPVKVPPAMGAETLEAEDTEADISEPDYSEEDHSDADASEEQS